MTLSCSVNREKTCKGCFELKINTNKLKVVLNRHAENLPFSLGNYLLTRCANLTIYDLGEVVSADSNHEREINQHCQRMNSRLPLYMFCGGLTTQVDNKDKRLGYRETRLEVRNEKIWSQGMDLGSAG